MTGKETTQYPDDYGNTGPDSSGAACPSNSGNYNNVNQHDSSSAACQPNGGYNDSSKEDASGAASPNSGDYNDSSKQGSSGVASQPDSGYNGSNKENALGAACSSNGGDYNESSNKQGSSGAACPPNSSSGSERIYISAYPSSSNPKLDNQEAAKDESGAQEQKCSEEEQETTFVTSDVEVIESSDNGNEQLKKYLVRSYNEIKSRYDSGDEDEDTVKRLVDAAFQMDEAIIIVDGFGTHNKQSIIFDSQFWARQLAKDNNLLVLFLEYLNNYPKVAQQLGKNALNVIFNKKYVNEALEKSQSNNPQDHYHLENYLKQQKRAYKEAKNKKVNKSTLRMIGQFIEDLLSVDNEAANNCIDSKVGSLVELYNTIDHDYLHKPIEHDDLQENSDNKRSRKKNDDSNKPAENDGSNKSAENDNSSKSDKDSDSDKPFEYLVARQPKKYPIILGDKIVSLISDNLKLRQGGDPISDARLMRQLFKIQFRGAEEWMMAQSYEEYQNNIVLDQGSMDIPKKQILEGLSIAIDSCNTAASSLTEEDVRTYKPFYTSIWRLSSFIDGWLMANALKDDPNFVLEVASQLSNLTESLRHKFLYTLLRTRSWQGEKNLQSLLQHTRPKNISKEELSKRSAQERILFDMINNDRVFRQVIVQADADYKANLHHEQLPAKSTLFDKLCSKNFNYLRTLYKGDGEPRIDVIKHYAQLISKNASISGIPHLLNMLGEHVMSRIGEHDAQYTFKLATALLHRHGSRKQIRELSNLLKGRVVRDAYGFSLPNEHLNYTDHSELYEFIFKKHLELETRQPPHDCFSLLDGILADSMPDQYYRDDEFEWNFKKDEWSSYFIEYVVNSELDKPILPLDGSFKTSSRHRILRDYFGLKRHEKHEIKWLLCLVPSSELTQQQQVFFRELSQYKHEQLSDQQLYDWLVNNEECPYDNWQDGIKLLRRFAILRTKLYVLQRTFQYYSCQFLNHRHTKAETISRIFHSLVDFVNQDDMGVITKKEKWGLFKWLFNHIVHEPTSKAIQQLFAPLKQEEPDPSYLIGVLEKLSEIKNETIRHACLGVFLSKPTSKVIGDTMREMLRHPAVAGPLLGLLYSKREFEYYRKQLELDSRAGLIEGVIKSSIQGKLNSNIKEPIRQKMAAVHGHNCPVLPGGLGKELHELSNIEYNSTLPLNLKECLKRIDDITIYIDNPYVTTQYIAEAVDHILDFRRQKNDQGEDLYRSTSDYECARSAIDKQLKTLFSRHDMKGGSKAANRLANENDGQDAIRLVESLKKLDDGSPLKSEIENLFIKKGWFNDRREQVLPGDLKHTLQYLDDIAQNIDNPDDADSNNANGILPDDADSDNANGILQAINKVLEWRRDESHYVSKHAFKIAQKTIDKHIDQLFSKSNWKGRSKVADRLAKEHDGQYSSYLIGVLEELSEIKNETIGHGCPDVFLSKPTSKPIGDIMQAMLRHPSLAGPLMGLLYGKSEFKHYRKQFELDSKAGLIEGVVKSSIQGKLNSNIKEPIRQRMTSGQLPGGVGKELHKLSTMRYSNALPPKLKECLKRIDDITTYIDNPYVTTQYIAEAVDDILDFRRQKNDQGEDLYRSTSDYECARKAIDKQLKTLFSRRNMKGGSKAANRLANENNGQDAIRLVKSLKKLDDSPLKSKIENLFIKKGWFNDRRERVLPGDLKDALQRLDDIAQNIDNPDDADSNNANGILPDDADSDNANGILQAINKVLEWRRDESHYVSKHAFKIAQKTIDKHIDQLFSKSNWKGRSKVADRLAKEHDGQYAYAVVGSITKRLGNQKLKQKINNLFVGKGWLHNRSKQTLPVAVKDKLQEIDHIIDHIDDETVSAQTLAQKIDELIKLRQHASLYPSQQAFEVGQETIDKRLDALFSKSNWQGRSKVADRLLNQQQTDSVFRVIKSIATGFNNLKLSEKFLSMFMKKGWFHNRLGDLLSANNFQAEVDTQNSNDSQAFFDTSNHTQALSKFAEYYQDQTSARNRAALLTLYDQLEDDNATVDTIVQALRRVDPKSKSVVSHANLELGQQLVDKLKTLFKKQEYATDVPLKRFLFDYQDQLRALNIYDGFLQRSEIRSYTINTDIYLLENYSKAYLANRQYEYLLMDNKLRDYLRCSPSNDDGQKDFFIQYYNSIHSYISSCYEQIAHNASSQVLLEQFRDIVVRFRILDKTHSVLDYKPINDVFDAVLGVNNNQNDDWSQLMMAMLTITDAPNDADYRLVDQLINADWSRSSDSCEKLEQLYSLIPEGNADIINQQSLDGYIRIMNQLINASSSQDLNTEHMHKIICSSFEWLAGVNKGKNPSRALRPAFDIEQESCCERFYDHVCSLLDVVGSYLQKTTNQQYKEDCITVLNNMMHNEANHELFAQLNEKQQSSLNTKLEQIKGICESKVPLSWFFSSYEAPVGRQEGQPPAYDDIAPTNTALTCNG